MSPTSSGVVEAGHSLGTCATTQDSAPGHLPPSETYRHPSAVAYFNLKALGSDNGRHISPR